MEATTRDGARIFYADYDFTDPWKAREAIMLHHGQRANHRVWYAWIPLLARHYRVIAVDARGRGVSSIPEPGFAWSLEQFASDDLAVLDDAGIDQVHFIGTSFGSAVGEYLGAIYPERLRSLTLISAPYRFDHLKDVIEGWLDDMERLGTERFLQRDVPNMFPADTDPRLVAWHIQQMAGVPDHVAQDLLKLQISMNLEDLLPKIAVPTLLLAASKSDRAGLGESEFMRERIPNARLVTIESHHNISATMPERCVEIILPFLREHRAG